MCLSKTRAQLNLITISYSKKTINKVYFSKISKNKTNDKKQNINMNEYGYIKNNLR